MNGKRSGVEGLRRLAELNDRQVRLVLLRWRFSLLVCKTSRGKDPEYLSVGTVGSLQLSKWRWASSKPVHPVGAGGGDAMGLVYGGGVMLCVCEFDCIPDLKSSMTGVCNGHSSSNPVGSASSSLR